MMNLTKRESYLTTQFETREEAAEQKLIIEGYFIKYDVETEIWEGCFEKIKRSAVENAIKNADVRVLFNHDTSLVLGRTGNGTAILRSDEVGLFAVVEINPNDPTAVGIYERIKRGDITGCSFGFFIKGSEESVRSDGTYLSVITEMELLEISPCTFPAYPQTEIAARQKAFQNYKERSLEQKKRELKEKLKYEK